MKQTRFLEMGDLKAALKPNQLQCGIRLGIPKGSLSQFLSGKQILALEHLTALAKDLETSPEHMRELFRNQSMILRDAPEATREMEPDQDWEGLFKWTTSDWDSKQLKQLSQAALEIDEYDYADMINAVLRDRKIASSRQDIEDAVASMPDAEAVAVGPAPGLPPKPGAAAPSVDRHSPSAGASPESRATHGSVKPVPK